MRLGWGAQLLLVAIIAGGSVFVVACSRFPRIAIYNNTGAPLGLHVDTGRTVDWDDKVVSINVGRSILLTRGKALRRSELLVTAAGCDYAYRVPSSRWPDIQFGDPIVVQVEADFVVHLKPPGRGMATSQELLPLQVHGFPLKPISSTCRPTTSPS
jgi:hypothetical protein